MENGECLEERRDLCRGHQPMTLPPSARTRRPPSAPAAVTAVPCSDRCEGLYVAQPPRWHPGTI